MTDRSRQMDGWDKDKPSQALRCQDSVFILW